ncbi:hypothetical protein PESP_a1797 [Pseudoalteromonas espejiana DSM 9414]|nr:hypothetical protein PESP_a1797 [Pseudoalteromonas espejiana DSM 9414]
MANVDAESAQLQKKILSRDTITITSSKQLQYGLFCNKLLI